MRILLEAGFDHQVLETRRLVSHKFPNLVVETLGPERTCQVYARYLLAFLPVFASIRYSQPQTLTQL